MKFYMVFVYICLSSSSDFLNCLHSTGRTGRAGHKGKAITFFTENDKPLLRRYTHMRMTIPGCFWTLEILVTFDLLM